MQGFGFGKYYPPDYDPRKHGGINKYRGTHALGDRARKIDQGILITRFELPFNIWCGTCDAHIGMGVRYNAEKRKVGSYYSTPIFAFRCKCHLCSGWFEIRTDPQNTRYVIESGARQKNEEWDPEDVGGHPIIDDKPNEPPDPFASIEKTQTDKQKALSAAERLESLEYRSHSTWSDTYDLNFKLRRKFRDEKKKRGEREGLDKEVRERFGLGTKMGGFGEVGEGLEEEDGGWFGVDGPDGGAKEEEGKEDGDKGEGTSSSVGTGTSAKRKREEERETDRKEWEEGQRRKKLLDEGEFGKRRKLDLQLGGGGSGALVIPSADGSSSSKSRQRTISAPTKVSYDRNRNDSDLQRSSSTSRSKPSLSRSLGVNRNGGSARPSTTKSSVSALTSKILMNTARKNDPFLNGSGGGGNGLMSVLAKRKG